MDMHELAVTQNLLDLALKHAEESNAKKITALYLVIGQLSSIVDDSVQFYWNFITENTLAAGSRLEFRRISPLMYCLDCQSQYTPADGDLSCPACFGIHVKILEGDEFRLEAIDIDT